MTNLAGLDVSGKETVVCVVDEVGEVVLEQRVPAEPGDVVALQISIVGTNGRVGIEAHPLSQWWSTVWLPPGRRLSVSRRSQPLC